MSNGIRNKYIKGSLGVTSIAGKMREGRLWWFGCVERKKDKNIVMNIGEIWVNRNQRRDRLKGK